MSIFIKKNKKICGWLQWIYRYQGELIFVIIQTEIDYSRVKYDKF